MGFRQGAYAKIWRIEDKGNYSVAQVSISRKKKDSDEYVTEFQHNFVRLVGNAHTAIQGVTIPEKGGLSIQITSCDVTNKWVAEKQKEYINFVIFGFDFPNGNNNSGNSNSKNSSKKTQNSKKPDDGFMNIPDGIDEELPFN